MPENPVTDTFEERLLAQLRSELPGPTARSGRRGWLLGGGVTATTALATAVAVALGTGQPAYGIHEAGDGSLTVAMRSTEPDDVTDAEADLRRRGVRIELVASNQDCLGVRGAPLVEPPHPPLVGPPSPEQRPELYAFQPVDTGRFLVRPDAVPADSVLWVALASDSAGLVTVAALRPLGAPGPDFCA